MQVGFYPLVLRKTLTPQRHCPTGVQNFSALFHDRARQLPDIRGFLDPVVSTDLSDLIAISRSSCAVLREFNGNQAGCFCEAVCVDFLKKPRRKLQRPNPQELA